MKNEKFDFVQVVIIVLFFTLSAFLAGYWVKAEQVKTQFSLFSPQSYEMEVIDIEGKTQLTITFSQEDEYLFARVYVTNGADVQHDTGYLDIECNYGTCTVVAEVDELPADGRYRVGIMLLDVDGNQSPFETAGLVGY